MAPETVVPMAGIMGATSAIDYMFGGGEEPAGMPSMEELAGLEKLEDDPYLSDLPQRRFMSPIHR